MSVSIRPLFTAQYAPNADTTMYTATGVKTIIDKFSGYNGTAAAVVVTVKLVPQGGMASASNAIASKTIAAGETYNFPEVCGHALEVGGSISVLAATASAVVIRASGREVS